MIQDIFWFVSRCASVYTNRRSK